MDVTLSTASTPGDFRAYGELIHEYIEWMRERIAKDAWFMDRTLSHQSLDTELETLAEKYTPPKGVAFLARSGKEIVGGGAYRDFGNGTCEMKRVFIRPHAQGKGVGRSLCTTLIDHATHTGYEVMYLDTARHLVEAIAMYESLGFHRCPAYQSYPAVLMPYLVFMKRPLRTK
jgi:GNAT superfamily N-acetyltransferase